MAMPRGSFTSGALSYDDFAARVRLATTRVHGMVETARTVAGDLVETNLTVGGRYSPGTPVDTGNALAGWERVRVGAVETFTNDVAYIRPLEYGHSKQAPAGFMRLTAMHWPDIAREAWMAARAGAVRGGLFGDPG